MGARGALKIAHGLSVVAPADTVAADVPAVAPSKPLAVANSPALDELWDQVVPELDKAGLLTVSDALALEMALRHFLLARQASEAIGGEVSIADHHNGGTLKKNPAVAVFRAESGMFFKYAQQLGMTFVSRARTPAAKGADDDGGNPFASASSL